MASFLDGGGISYLWKKITENFTPLSHKSAIANKHTAGHIYTLNKETKFNIGVPPSGFGSRGQGNANVQPCSDVADRYYAVEVDKSGYAFVNIPWTSGGLTGTVGSSTTPVYLSNGTITACGTELNVDISGNAATADSANYASEAELAEGALRVANPLYLIAAGDDGNELNRLTYDGSSIGAMTIMPLATPGTGDTISGIYINAGNRAVGGDYPISADVQIMLRRSGTDHIGGVKSFKTFSSGVTVPTISTTTTTPTIQTVSATSTRYYGLQTDIQGYGFVNVPWTDTKTTAGSSDKTGTKMYLIGATSQSSSGVTTYSNSNVYIGTDNKIYGETLESYVTWDDSTRVTSPRGTVNPISTAMCNETKANRFAFINSNAITIEYSTNGGSTWTDYGAGANSTSVFTEGYVVHVGRSADSSNAATTNCKTRVTICAQDGSNAYVYTRLKKLMICGYFANNVTCLVEAKKGASGSTWETIGTYDLGAPAYGTRWPAGSDWNDIPLKMNFGGIEADTNNYWYLRLTFSISKVNSSSLNTYFTRIYGYGPSTYYHASVQSGKGPMSQTDHLYSYNASADASFPAAIYATGYNNSSDARLKENMCSIEGDIDKLNDVKLIEFSYKNDENHTKHYGVTAQNLEEVGLNNLVSNIPPVNPEDEPYKGVDYISFLVLKIAQLEKKVCDLEKKLDDLQK